MPMPNFTDLTGLVSVASATGAAMLLLPGVKNLSKFRLALLLGAVFVLMLIPFGAIPPAAYLRGMTGDLSITTLILLWCAMLRPWFACVAVESSRRIALLVLIAFFALVLYPMALGVGAYDPYRLGYGSPFFVALLLLLALVAWLRKYSLIALCIASATLAWAIGWYESDNLWDYLLDPFLAVYAMAAAISCGMRAMIRSQRDSLG
jgi:hypothetical protein